MAENGAGLVSNYSRISNIDVINVDIIPEKKGLFIKHVEYIVSSKRFSSQVYRRYNDFVAFHEVLLSRFPYRLIPKLPPKKMVGALTNDPNFLEKRRKSLCRWLTFVARHPVISEDTLLSFFLTQNVSDLQSKLKDVFKQIPDEFTTSHLSAKAKELVPPNNGSEFATSREQIRMVQAGVSRFKEIADQIASRSHCYTNDMEDLGNMLSDLGSDSIAFSQWATGGDNTWSETRKGLLIFSSELGKLSQGSREESRKEEEEEVDEKLSVLLDVLSGYSELCERVERGVSQEHQHALSKMLSLKKRQIQGVLRGSDAESVAALENRMLEQESVIASVELRTAFSLYCVRMETQLVHLYLGVLPRVLVSLASNHLAIHSQLADVWKVILPNLISCFPPRSESKDL